MYPCKYHFHSFNYACEVFAVMPNIQEESFKEKNNSYLDDGFVPVELAALLWAVVWTERASWHLGYGKAKVLIESEK